MGSSDHEGAYRAIVELKIFPEPAEATDLAENLNTLRIS